MKPTQVTELLANIRKTFVSFFSILMFVALGVGIFLGISWTAPALQSAAGKVFDEGSFHSFQMQYPYGLTDADLKEIAGVEGVADVEPAYQSFQTLVVDGKNRTVKVQSLGQRIDVPLVVEGELPQQPDEIALSYYAADGLGIGVGDIVTFEKDGTGDAAAGAGADAAASSNDAGASGKDDGMKYLNSQAYTVSALVNSAEYLARSSSAYGYSTSASGAVDMVAWVVGPAFDGAAFSGGHPVVNVACDELAGLDTFSDEYSQKSAAIEARLTDRGQSMADRRYRSLRDEAQAKVDDGQKKLDKGKKKIEDGEKKLKDGEKKLEDGRAELDQKRTEGEAKLAEAHDELMQYESMREEGEAQLAAAKEAVAKGAQALAEADDAKERLETALEKLEEGGEKAREKYEASEQTEADLEKYHAKLDELGAAFAEEVGDIVASVKDRFGQGAKQDGQGLDAIELAASLVNHENFFESVEMVRELLDGYEDMEITYGGKTMTIREARKKLADARSKIRQGEAQLAEKVAQLEEGWGKYYAGKEELEQATEEGEKKLADGKKQLADAEKKLDSAKKEVAENEPKLEQAKQQLADMSSFNLSVASRSYNAGVAQVDVFSDVTTNLSFSMAALFVIVGLLVSYSAVSRIVHEQVTQIGTKKALGLRGREITLSFLAYAALAVVVGAIAGTAVGVTLVEGIIGHVLGGMFVMGDYPPYFGLPLFLIVTALELALVLGATWLACRSILRKHAVDLLKGEEPPAGKVRFYERWGLWDRLPLFTQTIVNNCMNDKRRVFSTVVGVAGCTALIVTAITLNNDVLKSYDKHYEDVYGFNAIAYVGNAADGGIDNVEAELRRQGAATAQVLRKTHAMTQPDGSFGSVRLIVPAYEDDFAEVYHVNPVAGEPFDSQGQGVWVSHAYAEHRGAKVGDKLVVKDNAGAQHELPILGFYEFWLTNYEMVVPAAFYEQEFGEAATSNVVLANTGGKAVEDVQAALSGVAGFDSIVDDKAAQSGNFAQFASVSRAVVLIYMALSVLMAIVVLLNLNTMFIDEKKRELIVLMINGFSAKYAKRYIYNDTIVLTIIGIVLGVVLGCTMGSVTVGAVEPSSATFVKSVDVLAVAVGVFGSAVLAFVMSAIALRRIPRFDLTDINKF